MKTFFNILIILLIGVLSSSFLVVLSPTNYKNSLEIDAVEEVVYMNLELNGEVKKLNPTTVVVNHTADKDKELSALPEDIFTANIYKDDKLVKENVGGLASNSISIDNAKYIITPDNPLKTNIDISQATLGLEDGAYKIVLISNLIKETDSNSIEINVEYESQFAYKPATSVNPVEGSTGITLYFADNNANYLIPVSRFINVTTYLNSHVIEELQKGPVDTGYLAKTIDVVNSCFYSDNGVMHIYLPKDNEYYNSSSAAGYLAYNSFLKTIFAMNRYWQINGIVFYADNVHTTEYFHGMQIPEYITKDPYPLVYLGFRIKDRMYLTDYGIKVDPAMAIPDIPSYMVASIIKNTNAPFRSPLPSDLVVNSATLEEDVLSVDFNQAFIDGCENNINKKNLMVDALIYSFTSIEGVNSVKFTVNGNLIENFIEGRDLTGVLTAPQYINPEI